MATPAHCDRTASPALGMATPARFDLTGHPVGWSLLALFVLAYVAVMFEERIHIAKSKPVMLGAGLIWALIAWQTGGDPGVHHAFEAMFLEYAEIFFFLVVAMTRSEEHTSALQSRGHLVCRLLL